MNVVDDDLLLPGVVPRLPRRCSRIVVTGGRYAGRRGILAEDPDGCPRVLVLLDASGGDDVVLEVLDVSDIALDLTDATGRAHAAWWLARHWPVGVAGKFTLLAGAMAAQHHQRAGRNVGVRFGPWATGEWLNWGSGLSDERYVPALVDIDPNDPRLLPDGSRRVDAVALARVCRHVARERGFDV